MAVALGLRPSCVKGKGMEHKVDKAGRAFNSPRKAARPGDVRAFYAKGDNGLRVVSADYHPAIHDISVQMSQVTTLPYAEAYELVQRAVEAIELKHRPSAREAR